MNPIMSQALKAGSKTPALLPETSHADCRAIETWVEKANFRVVTVREKQSKKTDKVNRTHGTNYAPRRWKKDHPAYYLKGIVNLPAESCAK